MPLGRRQGPSTITYRTALYPDEKAGPWQVTVWVWTRVDEVSMPIGVSVTSWPDALTPEGADMQQGAPPILTAAVLTELFSIAAPESIEEAARLRADLARRELLPATVLHALGTGDVGPVDAAVADLKAARARAKRAAGQSALGLPPEHYLAVAKVYLEHEHDARGPTVAVFEAFDNITSLQMASQHIFRARNAWGFLSPTTRGRRRRA